jgi:hypothetical protein
MLTKLIALPIQLHGLVLQEHVCRPELEEVPEEVEHASRGAVHEELKLRRHHKSVASHRHTADGEDVSIVSHNLGIVASPVWVSRLFCRFPLPEHRFRVSVDDQRVEVATDLLLEGLLRHACFCDLRQSPFLVRRDVFCQTLLQTQMNLKVIIILKTVAATIADMRRPMMRLSTTRSSADLSPLPGMKSIEVGDVDVVGLLRLGILIKKQLYLVVAGFLWCFDVEDPAGRDASNSDDAPDVDIDADSIVALFVAVVLFELRDELQGHRPVSWDASRVVVDL